MHPGTVAMCTPNARKSAVVVSEQVVEALSHPRGEHRCRAKHPFDLYLCRLGAVPFQHLGSTNA